MKTLLGKPVFAGDYPPYWKVSNEGVFGIFAPTMYGKSRVFDIIILGEALNKEYVVIFDYAGEHENLKYLNAFADRPDCIPDLDIVRNPCFMIEDFKKPIYWKAMEFPTVASQKLAEYAQSVQQHGNDPQLFKKLLEEAPISSGGQVGLHTATKSSIINKFREEVFIDPNNENEHRSYIPNWGEYIMKKKKVLINLNVNRTDRQLIRTYTGVILDQIREYIVRKKITPISIFLEEADVLAPHNEEMPYSGHLLYSLSLKDQKYGVCLYLVSQNVNQVAEDIRRNIRDFILGKLSPDDIFGARTQSLRWDIDKNYREFMILKKDGSQTKFTPFNCPILFDRRN